MSAVLSDPVILQAKLDIPSLPLHPVHRAGLVRRLDERGKAKCSAIIAPAGFGKTVAVVQRLSQNGIAAAWVTLDPVDNSLLRFWNYLVAALAPFISDNGERHIHTFLQAKSGADLENALPALIQQLGTSTADMFLILDDYHVISEPKIHETLFYFIRYAPQNIHVLLISRNHPPFILSRSKLGMDYREIGPAEFRFNKDEVAAYCGLMGLALTPAQHQALLSRTGGWPVALAFATEYLEQGGFAVFEEGFRGDNGEIGTYLEKEIFNAWPREEQEFLLHTSVLDSFNGPLCDALQESSGGSVTMLSNLSTATPFVVAHNSKKGWYRCAPLLQEYLRARLRREGKHHLPHLHRRAATWYWQNGFIHEAVHHFYQEGSHDLAVRLLEQQAPELLSSSRTVGVLLEWLDKFPPQLVESSGMLCLAGAWATVIAERLAEAEQWLEKAEALCGREQQEKASIPPLQLQQEISLLRVYLLIRQKNILPALELLDKNCRQLDGNSVFREKGLALHGAEPSVLPGPLGLYGRLQQLAGLNHSIQGELSRIGFPSRYLNLVRAELFYEYNNLEAAVPALMEGLEAAERTRSLDAQVPIFFVLARIYRTWGQFEEALQVVAEAERRVYSQGELQWQHLLSALKVRLYLHRGDLEPARQWLQDDAPGTYDRPSATREYAQLTLARVLLADLKYHKAMLLLERQLAFAQQEDRLPSIIEILNLQALVCQELGQTGKALALLDRSLRLGCPEGYVRTFIDEGSHMWALLHKYARGVTRQAQEKPDRILSYVRSLLRYMKRDVSSHNHIIPRQELSSTGAGALLDPLTKRELQVLQLLAQDLSNADIATALSITLNTVKVFNRNIFAKLEVKNRTSAVERARALCIVE